MIIRIFHYELVGGKLIGSGIGLLGGPMGALVGAAIGHLYDEDDITPQDEKKARILYIAYFVRQKSQKLTEEFLRKKLV